MINEIAPNYIKELKDDLIKHLDSSLDVLAITIYNTVVLKDDVKDMVTKQDIKDMVVKSDIKNMATKDDIKNMATKQDIEAVRSDMATKDDIRKIWDNMATKEDIKEVWDNMATKSDVKEILSHIGRYEVRARKVEEILLEDHKPRIIDLEKEVYS